MARILWCIVLLAQAACGRASDGTTVCTAASMREAVRELFPHARIMSASSSRLARQIDSGAPCDVFVSADVEWVRWLANRGRASLASLTVVAGNGLVVVVSAEYRGGWRSAPRWSTGDPRGVPLGRYAKQALGKLGAWEALRPRLVGAVDAAAAVRLVTTGEVDAAVLYASDAQRHALLVVERLPASSHDSIQYVAVAVGATSPRSVAVLERFRSPEATRVLRRLGFAAP